MKDYSTIIENLMDGIITILEESYDCGYQQGYADAKSELGQNAIDLAHEESDRAYQQGLEDAWEAAKKIAMMDTETSENITGYFGLFRIMEYLTPMQAIEIIKEYEDKQKHFAVGDEVYSDAFDNKGIITHITADKVSCVCIICNGSTMMKVGTNGLHKTGKHFDAIAEVLAEMRGEE